MADDIDMAQEAYERSMNYALAKQLSHQAGGDSLTHCENCEEEIPEARRLAVPGCKRCVKCQESLELLSHWRK